MSSLLIPDTGLLFWMLISFGIVFFVLAKFGFPVIVNMVEKRKNYIEKSLLSAKEANEQLVGIKAEGDKLITEARKRQLELMQDASDMREKLVREAREQAKIEAEKLMDSARLSIEKERDDAMKQVRGQVVELSVSIAEKLLRKNLSGDRSAQIELVEKLIEEAKQ